ncbi:MAG: trypsin-like serine protease, partial [Caldilineaceae bacterium]|nr:trypsin-like serine protease [Caldilineaceae bacterium]
MKRIGLLGVGIGIALFVLLQLWQPTEPTAVQAAPPAQQDTTAQRSPNAPTIIGGQEAAPGAWPWMAALVLHSRADARSGQFCGGSLIAADWVLTAGHCTYKPYIPYDPYIASEMDVVVGRHQLSSNDGERITVTKIIRHPGYVNRSSFDNDVALLQLSHSTAQTPVKFINPQT